MQVNFTKETCYDIAIENEKLVFLSVVKQPKMETTTAKIETNNSTNVTVTISNNTTIVNSTISTTNEETSNKTLFITIICVVSAVFIVVLLFIVKHMRNSGLLPLL